MVGTTDATSATSALLATISGLFPAGEVGLVAQRRPDPSAAAEFLVLPHRRSPRLLLPVGAGGAASVLRFSASAELGDTVRRLVMSAALRLGGSAALPDRIVVHGSRAGSLADHLGELLGEPVTFSVGIGTARVNRKPVLQVFGADGRTLAFAKVGDSPVARADVDAEARSLARVGERHWHRLVLPSVLHHGPWGAGSLLLLTPLRTSPFQSPRAQDRAPVAAMRELAEGFGGTTAAVASLGWLGRQRAAFEGLGDATARSRVLTCLDRVADGATVPWRTGAWHGDWTPWNMARTRDHLQLWDFERFETDVPMGLDPCHYYVNTLTRRLGTTPRTIRAGLAAAGARPDEPGTRPHVLGALYLLAVAGRYLPLAEGLRGEDIAPRAAVVVETLEDWVGVTRP